MLLDCLKRFDAQASEVSFVGDTWRDTVAALRAGCKPVLVRTGHGAETITAHESGAQVLPEQTLVVDSLESWVHQMLSS